MWVDLISRLSRRHQAGTPAARDKLRLAESVLRVALPESLNDLLCEADGIEVDDGLGRVWAAPGLREYLEWWLTGRLTT